ncbi:MAG: hypothetical protein ACLFQK_00325 [Fibrobacterota bacterium]
MVFLVVFPVFTEVINWSAPELRPALMALKDHDTLCLSSGNYFLKPVGWVSKKKNIAVISGEGPGKAVINGPGKTPRKELLSFNDCSNILIEGLEIRNSGDNALKISACRNVIIKGCYIHNAFGQGDCIKITVPPGNFSENISILNCISHSPGLNEEKKGNREYEECLDMIRSKNVLIKNCWFFHIDTLGNQLSYPKCGCSGIRYESCLFGPQSKAAWDPAVGGGASSFPGLEYNVVDQTVSNSIFVDCPHGAVVSFGSKNFSIIGNIFMNCGGRTRYSPPKLGIVHVKSLKGKCERNDGIYIKNNVFYNESGIVYPFAVQSGSVSGLEHSGNIYFNKNGEYKVSDGYEYRSENKALFCNPYCGKTPGPVVFSVTEKTDFRSLADLRDSIMLEYRPENENCFFNGE